MHRLYSCPIEQGVNPLIFYLRYRGWKSKNDLNVFVVILVVGLFHLRLVVVRCNQCIHVQGGLNQSRHIQRALFP